MPETLTIARYEYKMQIRRPAAWILLLAVAAVSMMDSLPTAANRVRLEFVEDIRYYVWRVFSFDGLLLLFGIFFLTAGRLADDRKSRCRDLFMAAPIGKAGYLSGKLLGNMLFGLTLMYSLLAVSLLGFALVNPVPAVFSDYADAVISISLYSVLPATFFVVADGVMLPELTDIRLVYLLFAILFFVNAFSTHTLEEKPFYLLTQGDWAQAVWQHPRFPGVHTESAHLNLAFLLGTGAAAAFAVAVRRRFWRAE